MNSFVPVMFFTFPTNNHYFSTMQIILYLLLPPCDSFRSLVHWKFNKIMLKYHKKFSSYVDGFIIILGMQDINVDDRDRSYVWEFKPIILTYSNILACIL